MPVTEFLKYAITLQGAVWLLSERAGIVLWMPPERLLFHQIPSPVKKRTSHQIHCRSALAQTCLRYKPAPHQVAENRRVAFGGKFPLYKAFTFWHVHFVTPANKTLLNRDCQSSGPCHISKISPVISSHLPLTS